MRRNLSIKKFLSLIIALVSVNVLFAQTPPTITTNPASRILPKGSTAIFTVAATGDGPITYQWRKDGVAIQNATSSSFVIDSVVVARFTNAFKGDEGDYDCVVTNPYGSATSSIASLLVPRILPYMKSDTMYVRDTTVCYKYTAPIKATGGVSYLWATGETTGSITRVITNITAQYYKVTITGADFVVVDSINVKALGKLNYSLTPSLNLCNGQVVPIECFVTSGNTYKWQNGTSGAFNIGPISSDTAFYITVTKTVTGCNAYDSVVVGFSNAPAPTIDLPTSQNICPGSSFSAETTPTFVSYLWSNGATTNTIYPTTSGAYYTVTVTDANNCKVSDKTFINIYTITTLDLGPDITMTTDQSVVLGAPNDMTYLWSNGETTQNIIIDGNTLTEGNYTYSVTVTHTASTCEFIDSINITVKPGIGIESINSKNLFNVYPNPSTGIFTVETNNVENNIEIYTISGSQILNKLNSNNIEYFDLSNYEKGLYLIKVSNNSGSLVKKIFIE